MLSAVSPIFQSKKGQLPTNYLASLIIWHHCITKMIRNIQDEENEPYYAIFTSETGHKKDNHNYDLDIITTTMDNFISYKHIDDQGHVLGGDFAVYPLKKELADENIQRGGNGPDRYYPITLIYSLIREDLKRTATNYLWFMSRRIQQYSNY